MKQKIESDMPSGGLVTVNEIDLRMVHREYNEDGIKREGDGSKK
jgi:hypothetical protein